MTWTGSWLSFAARVEEPMRKTKIVATVGPACRDPRLLKKMIHEGVDVFRINASHTDPAGIGRWFKLIRAASASLQKHTAILVDLQGPRVRTGHLKNSSLRLEQGKALTIRIGRGLGGGNTIMTACLEFPRMVKKNDKILIDNGVIELKVESVQKRSVSCRVVTGGILGENKGINLPNAPVTLPALTAKDLQDLAAASKLHADYIALSFVRSVEDVEAIKRWMRVRRIDIPVIAKIEKPQAVESISAVLEKADGIMVARGDLGIEMGIEKVPRVQKMLIERAVNSKIPVITATQMLETMMEKPQPTRAEVSDIANAVFDGTDAVMLSGETAIGKYPLQSVQTMRKIIEEAEVSRKILPEDEPFTRDKSQINLRAITQAALYAARELDAKGIMVFTLSGKTAQYVSKLNPSCMVLAVSRSARTLARLNLLRGVRPVLAEKSATMDEMIHRADQKIMRDKILKKGDAAVVVYGKRALPGILYTIAIHSIGESKNSLSARPPKL